MLQSNICGHSQNIQRNFKADVIFFYSDGEDSDSEVPEELRRDFVDENTGEKEFKRYDDTMENSLCSSHLSIEKK